MRDPMQEDSSGLPIALLGFFLITFMVTWAAWMTVAGRTGFFGPGGPLFLLGVFAPALVAIATTAYEEGRHGVSRLLARIGRWRVDARWYLFAISYMAVTKLLAAVIHRVVMGVWPAFSETPWLFLFGAVVLSMWAQAGEEIGWRGYALPRLARHLGLGGASLLLGVIWALWHLPLFYLEGSPSRGQSFPVYLLHVTALSVAMAWLYWKTEGSLLLVMLMHASVNNTTGIVPAALLDAVDPFSFEGSLVAWSTVGISWLAAVVFLLQMRGAEIDGTISTRARSGSSGNRR